jgi:hypothetical protein
MRFIFFNSRPFAEFASKFCGQGLMCVFRKKHWPHLTPALSPPSDGAEREKPLRPLRSLRFERIRVHLRLLLSRSRGQTTPTTLTRLRHPLPFPRARDAERRRLARFAIFCGQKSVSICVHPRLRSSFVVQIVAGRRRDPELSHGFCFSRSRPIRPTSSASCITFASE